jgi:sulfatase modifying factor 1
MKNIGMLAVIFIMFITGCGGSTDDAPTPTSNDYTSANIGILKYVPAGSFQRDGDAGNISTITTAFRMSQYEITRSQFLAVMGTDPSNVTYSTGVTDPVQMTNWYHAIAFCNKLSIAEGFTRVYDVAGFTTDQNWIDLAFGSIPTSDNATWNLATATWTNTGYRLPTEMEWEWAAMGATSDGRGADIVGSVNTGGYTKGYAGSTELDTAILNIGDYAWYSVNSPTTTKPVGTTGTTGHANELGLYDMSGNVWEWIWDWDAAYPNGALDNNTFRGAVSGTYRVIRGGSWTSVASRAAVDYRNNSIPISQFYDLGFRVVRP